MFIMISFVFSWPLITFPMSLGLSLYYSEKLRLKVAKLILEESVGTQPINLQYHPVSTLSRKITYKEITKGYPLVSRIKLNLTPVTPNDSPSTTVLVYRTPLSRNMHMLICSLKTISPILLQLFTHHNPMLCFHVHPL